MIILHTEINDLHYDKYYFAYLKGDLKKKILSSKKYIKAFNYYYYYFLFKSADFFAASDCKITDRE